MIINCLLSVSRSHCFYIFNFITNRKVLEFLLCCPCVFVNIRKTEIIFANFPKCISYRYRCKQIVKRFRNAQANYFHVNSESVL